MYWYLAPLGRNYIVPCWAVKSWIEAYSWGRTTYSGQGVGQLLDSQTNVAQQVYLMSLAFGLNTPPLSQNHKIDPQLAINHATGHSLAICKHSGRDDMQHQYIGSITLRTTSAIKCQQLFGRLLRKQNARYTRSAKPDKLSVLWTAPWTPLDVRGFLLWTSCCIEPSKIPPTCHSNWWRLCLHSLSRLSIHLHMCESKWTILLSPHHSSLTVENGRARPLCTVL